MASCPARRPRPCRRAVAAEVGRGRVLAGLDDAAPDGARLHEQLVERVAVAEADGALQRGQVLAEARQHLQHRLLVVEEHVAPHDGIGGGDAREVAEAAGRELDHLGVGDALQMPRGVDDVVGDQVRHVAGDGQHQVVVLGVHHLDVRAAAPARTPTACRPRPGSAPGGGVSTHQRPSNSSAKPASGPECSVPAIGWPGNEMHALRHERADVAHARRP